VIARVRLPARHFLCRAFFFGAAALCAGCTPADHRTGAAAEEPRPAPVPVLAGRLQNKDIDEASGIAHSYRNPGTYWVIVDSGKPRLYAIDEQGRHRGRVKLDDGKLVDWEDIASFSLQGRPFLLVADIGDNESERKDVRLYVVEEPAADDSDADIAWEFDFSYPGGPRDAEAIAVDVAGQHILVLSKREVPAVMYVLPLRPAGKGRATAQVLVAMNSLPQPGRHDIEFAPLSKDYWWQPTALDISADGRAAVILTYGGVYYYSHRVAEDWAESFRRKPTIVASGNYREAESVAFSGDGTSVYVTFEGHHAPLVRIDLNGATP
jgi:hypothetical protein